MTSLNTQAEGDAVAIGPDDKIVVAATAWYVESEALLIRYLANGDLDPSFGDNGIVRFATDGVNDGFNDIMLQGDRIVAVGFREKNMLVVRVLGDGSLDPTFGGGDGQAIVRWGFHPNFTTSTAKSVEPAGVENILVGGSIGSGSARRVGVVRLGYDGYPDTSFSEDGFAAADWNDHPDDVADSAGDIAVSPAGDITLAGCTDYGAKTALARWDSTGKLVRSFGGDGKVQLALSRGAECALAVAPLDDESVLIAGFGDNRFNSDFLLAKITGAGELDTGFGNAGKRLSNFKGHEAAQAVLVDTGGRIILVGETSSGTPDTQVALARYDAGGNLDPSFGGNGKLQTSITNGADAGLDAELDSQGRYVAVGYAWGSNIAVVRYLPG